MARFVRAHLDAASRAASESVLARLRARALPPQCKSHRRRQAQRAAGLDVRFLAVCFRSIPNSGRQWSMAWRGNFDPTETSGPEGQMSQSTSAVISQIPAGRHRGSRNVVHCSDSIGQNPSIQFTISKRPPSASFLCHYQILIYVIVCFSYEILDFVKFYTFGRWAFTKVMGLW
jgi:hypothetical protein